MARWLIHLARREAWCPRGMALDLGVWVLGPPRIGADIPAKLLSLIGRWLPVVSCLSMALAWCRSSP